MAALLLLCGVSLTASAQVGRVTPPGPGTNPGIQYNVVIDGDFETKCTLPNVGHTYYDENPEAIVACQGQEVNYTAYASTGTDNVTGWSWSVDGAVSFSANGNGATVLWGDGTTGELTVTVAMSSGRTYTHHQTVRLIEKPVAGAISVPAYGIDRIVYVCEGMDVEFIDQSQSEGSEIAGFYWEGCGSTSTTPSFLLEDVTMPCTVTHRVYNICGCYDEETYFIEVLYGEPLELSCYGTVCEGSTVEYYATSPLCSQYFWRVEGGQLVGGQGTANITVTWDSPQDGYGVVTLDGTLCDNGACRSSLSVRVPVIRNGVPISGQTVVCEGEAVEYSVPLYGSTRYTWNITPPTGVTPYYIRDVNANRVEYSFTNAGTYTISVKYKCDFLACGEFDSEPLTVVVKPRFKILGENEVCLTNTTTLTTDADPNDNLVTWKVYNSVGNQLVYTSPTPVAQLSSNVIPNAGKYRITAENSNYCNGATFILTVKDPPPAPTVTEMSPDNPTVACPYSTIRLNASPSNPLYNVIWEACTTATPASVSGEEVSITYGAEVCNVEAYHYDRELQCRSSQPYTHTVVPFVLAQTLLPTQPVTVCPGTRIVWDNNIVPAQDDVLYEWMIEDEYQYCATIEGDIHSSAVTLLVNDIDYAITNPIPFKVYLYRRYCGHEDTAVVQLIIYPNSQPSGLGISSQTPVCQHSTIQLTGSGCSGCLGGSGTYRWFFPDNGQTLTGTSVEHTFDYTGSIPVTLTCNPYDYCTNGDYLYSVSGTVQVIPTPPAVSIGYDGTDVFIEPPIADPAAYDFHWGHTAINSDRVTASVGGGVDYSCMIISHTVPPCTTEVKNEAVLCNRLQTGTPSIDYCSHKVSFSVVNQPGPVVWTVLEGGSGDPVVSGPDNESVTVTASNVGYLTVRAQTEDDPCYSAIISFSVDFLPDFSLQKACSTIVIYNNSQYLDGSKMIKIGVTSGDGTTDYFSFPASQGLITYPTGSGGHYEFNLVSYDGQTISCPLGDVDIQNTSNLLVEVVSANTGHIHQTCNNTAIQLTASLPSPHIITHSHWDYDDNGTFIDTNGNSVYHTFRYIPNNYDYYQYNISVRIIDENGCTSNGELRIFSYENELAPESLEIDGNTPLTCPENNRIIKYLVNGNNPQCTTATYNWSTTPYTGTLNEHNTYYTDDYSVIVTNDNYCKTEATVNVPFKNQPSAVIIPKKYYYCLGETVILHGEPDDVNNYHYQWAVYCSATNQTVSYYTGTVSFIACTTACTYTVNLTVTNSEGCTAQANPVTITVVNNPTAPNISIDPNHSCIDQYPVKLYSNNPSQMLHWSNGDYGIVSYYHYPGLALAYYYDPVSGCRSDSAFVTVPAAPDFDALLTGCYRVCDSLADSHLPVYGLLPSSQEYGWDWNKNNSSIDHGSFGYHASPLSLPLRGFGEYYLDVNYYGNCEVSSKPLVLEEEEPCRCDSIDISYVVKRTSIANCILSYDIIVTVCNNTTRNKNFNSLVPLFTPAAGHVTITNNTFAGLSLNANDCDDFSFTLNVGSFDPMVASFRLEGRDCTADFCIDLFPEVSCSSQVTTGQIADNGMTSDDNTIYCNFSFNVAGATSVLAVWSEPQSVINYTTTYYTIGSGNTCNINGLCSFNKYDVMTNGTACVYALVCINNEFCIYYYCVTASSLLEGAKTAKPHSSAGGKSDDFFEPSLMPNPTMGEVTVVGTPDEVVEILVMDMKGRSMATFTGTDRFNISNLPSGAYIVRVKTIHNIETQEKVSYIKLVKK